MRPSLRVGIVLVLVVGGTFAAHPAAGARNSEESGFFARLNAERTGRGIGKLAWSEDLAAVARRHSQRMASNDRLYHNPNLAHEVHGWQELGENVGFGSDVEQLHVAFMESSVHRDAILHRGFTRVGVGTVWRDGALWVTEVFDRPMAVRATTTTQRARTTSTPSRPGGRTAGTPVAPAAATAVAVRPPAGPAPLGDLTRIMVAKLLAQDPAPGRTGGPVPGGPVLRTIPLLMPLGR